LKILAFDTATPATTVALARAGEPTLALRDDPPAGERPRHATRLLGLISQLLDQAGTGWDSIDRIAVGVGPGTFTGVRIGVATAKALARAAETPLVGVSTLHSLAWNARSVPGRAVAAVLDARRGEAFVGVWETGGFEELRTPLLSPRALLPDALVQALRPLGEGLVAIGDGALAFREHLELGGVSVPEDASELHQVSAAGHCHLARLLPVTHPDELQPDYQRPPDAQPRDARSIVVRGPDER